MENATENSSPALSVDDFAEASKLTTEDFATYDSENTEGQVKAPSISQLAAYETLKKEFPTQESFRAVQEQLTTVHGREAFMKSRQEKSDARVQEIRKDVSNLLSDPKVDLGVKQQSVGALGIESADVDRSEMDDYSEAALLADSDVHETEEASEARGNMGESFAHVNAQKRLLQQAINGTVVEQSGVEVAVDIAELMVPFAEWLHIDSLQQDALGDNHNVSLLGSQKKALFEQFEKMPLDKKVELSQTLIDMVTDNENVVFTDGNQLMKVDTLRKMLLDNDYSTGEKWFDNITSVLDVIGLGSVVKTVAKSGKVAKIAKSIKEGSKAQEIADKAKAYVTQTKVSPTSPVENAKDVNPEQARKMHMVIASDETGEASKALSGATPEEAIIKAELPDPEVVTGKVPNKVKMEGPQFREPDRIRKARQRDGASYLSVDEVATVRTKLIDGFEDIEGMNIHKNSISVRTTEEGRFALTARYSPRDSGFSSAARAVENAEFAFRHYGLGPEDFVLYERVGSDLVETSAKDLKAKAILREGFTKAKKKIPEELKTIDYVVGVRHETGISPQDIDIYDALTVKRNWLDRADIGIGKSGQGSITQHLVDAASTLHPQIVEPASVAVDKGVFLKKAYISMVSDFSKAYNKAPKVRRAKMTDYINEANEKGLRFDDVDLMNRGFSEAERGTLKEWRRANDVMYHATNSDMAKTMHNKGFQGLVHNDSNTLMYVKPVKRNGVGAGTAYNPRTSKVEEFTTEQLNDLYESGGGIAKTNEPVEVDGSWIEKVVYTDTPDGGYLRAIRDDETVLAYRDGYYPVLYDAEFFIQKEIKVGADMRVKTIASAKTKKDLDRAMAKLQKSEPDTKFIAVADRRRGTERGDSFDENGWSLAQSSGVSAQRVRGERLVDAGVDLEKAGRTNLADPLEAISAQIESISSRVSMRNYLDTTKSRWMSNYADKLDLPETKFGEVQFPAKVTDIKGKTGTSGKTVADARTLYNYLHTLENGYINTVDDSFKALMHWGADEMSNIGFGKGDEFLRSAAKGGGPTGSMKGAAFKLYLAANPLRQAVIQGHQTVQLAALSPRYVVAGGLSGDLMRMGKAALGIAGKDKEAVEMWQELRRTGLLDAVDENNLVRAGMLQLAELGKADKARALAGKPFNILQQAGFDKGEQVVVMTSWLTHRKMAVDAGVKLDRRALDEIAGKARAFTYNMNKAGDMPYNQNTLNMVAQFMQVPHKAMLQMFTNRSLTRTQRAKLATFNLVMYGVPTGMMGYLYNNMEEGKLRDTLEHGLEDVVLNKVASEIFNEEQQVDWGDLSPTNAYGLRDFTVGLLTTDISSLIASSPSGSLFFGNNPRLTNTFKTALRWANVIDDYDDPLLDTKFTDVGMAFVETMSGASNAFKANYSYKALQKKSSTGNITDSDSTKFEAVMQAFGFQTRTESSAREVNKKIYGEDSFTPSDVRLWYSEVKRHLNRRGDSVREQDIRERVLAEGMRVFDDAPFKFRDELLSLIQKDAKSGDTKVVDNIMRKAGIMENSEVRTLINTLPKSEMRDNLNLWIDNVEKAEQQ